MAGKGQELWSREGLVLYFLGFFFISNSRRRWRTWIPMQKRGSQFSPLLTNKIQHLLIELHNHSDWKGPQEASGPSSCSKMSFELSSDQLAKVFVQLGLENFQGWKFYHLFFPALNCSDSELISHTECIHSLFLVTVLLFYFWMTTPDVKPFSWCSLSSSSAISYFGVTCIAKTPRCKLLDFNCSFI